MGPERRKFAGGQAVSCVWCGNDWTETYTDRCTKCADLWREMAAHPERARAMLDKIAPRGTPPTNEDR
jgi:hypothetical protein